MSKAERKKINPCDLVDISKFLKANGEYIFLHAETK